MISFKRPAEITTSQSNTKLTMSTIDTWSQEERDNLETLGSLLREFKKTKPPRIKREIAQQILASITWFEDRNFIVNSLYPCSNRWKVFVGKNNTLEYAPITTQYQQFCLRSNSDSEEEALLSDKYNLGSTSRSPS